MRLETSRIYPLTREVWRRPTWLKVGLVCLVVLILSVPRALAQPAEPAAPQPMPTLHMRLGTGEGTLRGPNGKDYVIPQGSHILAPESWLTLDAEFLRLQEAETRLDAENKSLRKSADSVPWLPIAVGIAVGIAAGAYVGIKYF